LGFCRGEVVRCRGVVRRGEERWCEEEREEEKGEEMR
jgi:hypothetical protein